MFKAFGLFWKNFAQAKGRTGRKNFWLAALLQLIVCAVIGVAAFLSTPFRFVAAVYALVCLVPSFALQIRRLHDTDKKGSSLFLYLIPIAGAIIMFVFFLRKSSEGENRFGLPEGAEASPVEVPAEAQGAQTAAEGFVIPPIYRSDSPDAVPAPEYSPTGEPVSSPSYTAPGGSTAYTPCQPAEPQPSAQYVPDFGFGSSREVYADAPQTAAQASSPADGIPFVTPEPVSVEEAAAQPVHQQPVQPTNYFVPQTSLYDTPVYAYKSSAAPASAVTVTDPEPESVETAQPEPQSTPQTPFKPRGYKTKGFPYGH